MLVFKYIKDNVELHFQFHYSYYYVCMIFLSQFSLFFLHCQDRGIFLYPFSYVPSFSILSLSKLAPKMPFFFSNSTIRVLNFVSLLIQIKKNTKIYNVHKIYKSIHISILKLIAKLIQKTLFFYSLANHVFYAHTSASILFFLLFFFSLLSTQTSIWQYTTTSPPYTTNPRHNHI